MLNPPPFEENGENTLATEAAGFSRRAMQGQYYTPGWLCDFMLALSSADMQLRNKRLLDPGCGPGAFLLRAFDCFRQEEESTAQDILTRLHGVEIEADAAQRARRALQALADCDGGKIDIVTGDFLNFQAVPDSPAAWDIIVGNPPYVRHEHLAQHDPKAKAAALSLLASDYAAYLARHPEQRALFSGTADLYLLFFLRAATLLKPGGRLAFVTSNSWLNTAIGGHFRRWLHHHFRVLALVESACERWFADAAVNAAVLVLERLEPGETCPGNHQLRLLRLRQPLADWLGDPARAGYWPDVKRKISSLSSDKRDAGMAAIRHIAQAKLLMAESPVQAALLLRAPDFIGDWLAQPELHTSIEALGRLRYPLKTGINRFFYLSRAEAEARRIEPECLRPVAKSIRRIPAARIREADCETLLFCCPHEKSALAERGLHGALAYIEWGETQLAPARQKRARPVPWPQVASVRGNRPWHAIRPLPPAHLLCSRFADQRFLFPVCDGDIIEDQTFYGLTLADPSRHPPLFVAALLNSTLSFALLEFAARTSLGEGVLQFSRGDMAAFPMPHPDLYGSKAQAAIVAAFSAIVDMPVPPVAEALHQPERLALDRLILAPLLEAMGRPAHLADIDACRGQLADALLARMAERQRMARGGHKRGGRKKNPQAVGLRTGQG